MAYEPHNVCERNKNLSTKTKEEMVEHLTYLLQKKKKTRSRDERTTQSFGGRGSMAGCTGADLSVVTPPV